MKTKYFGLILFLCFYYVSYGNKTPFFNFNSIHKHSFSIDASQLFYIFNNNSPKLNLGLSYHYRPINSLSINSSFFYNAIDRQGDRGYDGLSEYLNKGICIKSGYDISISISKDKKTRLFFGNQFCFIRSKEIGKLEINYYWGNYKAKIESQNKNNFAFETIFGLKKYYKNYFYSIQVYNLSLNRHRIISKREDFLKDYRTPFVPGFGYRSGGVNLLIGYQF